MHTYCYLNRFERLWEEEVRRNGAENASVARTIVRMVSGRLICAAIINIVLNTAPLLRSVSCNLFRL